MILAGHQTVYAEMPPKPTIENLCRESSLILSAEPVAFVDVPISINTEYRVITFKIHAVYKGQPDTELTLKYMTNEELENDMPEKQLITVIIYTRRSASEYLPPSYKQNHKYLLFLGPRVLGRLYIRSEIDESWKETLWTKEKEEMVREFVKKEATVWLSRPPGKNVKYTIPKNAIEKSAPLTKYDYANKYSRKVEYWLDGKKVGKRGWWTTGKLAYERAIKDGMRHGLYRGWYPNGTLWQERYYKNDKMHGVYTSWDKKGQVDVSFWIDGKNVTEAAYLQAAKFDKTLPEYTKWKKAR